jgi:hypothetical protein
VVYLVLTRAGFEQVRSKLQPSDIVWSGLSVLSIEEAAALRGEGIELTVFSHDVDPADAGAAAGWTFTVAERHPNQPIWVERQDDDVQGRRKSHRSLQIWICAVLLAISAALSGVGALAASRGKDVSESTDMLWTFVFSVLLTLWARADDRYPVTRSKGDYSYLLMFFFWPVVLLNHALRSRGMEGAVLYVGFMAIYFVPYVVRMAVWVWRML